MISSASFRNFKSIKKIENLELKPLTIFTGSNASGKSTILEGIGLFAEAARRKKTTNEGVTLNSVLTNTQSMWRYPTGELQNFIPYKRDPQNSVSIEITTELSVETKKKIAEVFEEYSIGSPYLNSSSISYSVEFRYSDNAFEQVLKIDSSPIAKIYRKNNKSKISYFDDNSEDIVCPINPESLFDEKFFETRTNTPEDIEGDIARLITLSLKKNFQHVYLISGERGKIDPQLVVSNHGGRMQNIESPPSWVGYKGEHVIELLSRFFTREQTIAKKIQEWGTKFQIPEIRAGYVGEGKLETNFVDPQSGTSLNASLAGLGSRQILPVIAQIFVAEVGSTIMIEEPEISLHPEHQVLLHELFATAINQGKQIICTTHSPFLILALSRLVRKKLLLVEEIAVYHIEKDNGGTKVKELELDKRGFLKDGVPSFMKTERELFQEWSDALEED
jgi:predicted ATPase